MLSTANKHTKTTSRQVERWLRMHGTSSPQLPKSSSFAEERLSCQKLPQLSLCQLFPCFPLDLLFPSEPSLTSQLRKPVRHSPKLGSGSTRQQPTYGRMSPLIDSVRHQSCVLGKLPGHMVLGGEWDPMGLFWDASIHWVFSYSCHACWPTFCSYPDSSFKQRHFQGCCLGN